MSPKEIAAGKGLKFQDEFAYIFKVKGAPVDAAMFENRRARESKFYFTLEAFKIAPVLISIYGGVECAEPTGSSLIPLVTTGPKWQEFVRSLTFPLAG